MKILKNPALNWFSQISSTGDTYKLAPFCLFVLATLISGLFFFEQTKLPNQHLTIGLFLASLMVLLSSLINTKLNGLLKHNYAFNILLGLLFGFSFTGIQMLNYKPLEVPQKYVLLEIKINNINQKNANKISFEGEIIKAEDKNLENKNVKLSWYLNYKNRNTELAKKPKIGDIWQMQVKLKQPHSWMNPFGFDYEKYIFSTSIDFIGYVKSSNQNSFLKSSYRVSQLRYFFKDKLTSFNEENNFKNFAIFKALLVGDKSGITSEQWSTFSKLGVIHLLAISGMHLTIVGGLGFLLGSLLWTLLILFNCQVIARLPKIYFAASSSLLFISCYFLISGFSIPTQRAYFLSLFFIVFLFIKKKYLAFNILAMAGLIIFISDPKNLLQPGFWLSCLAVMAILLILNFDKQDLNNNITGTYKLNRNKVWLFFLNFFKIQLGIFIILTPALLYFFNTAPNPLISLVANFAAIPIISFVILPSLIFALILFLFLPIISKVIFNLNDFLISKVFNIFNWLEALDFWQLPLKLNLWQVLIIYLVFACLVWWRKDKLKLSLILSLSFAGLFVSIYNIKDPDKEPLLSILVFDVGQGLASFIQTNNNYVLFDTGNFYSHSFNGFDSAIKPYMLNHKIKTLDKIIISHKDKDHSGALNKLLISLPNQSDVITSEPEKLQQASISIKDKLARNIKFKTCDSKADFKLNQLNFNFINLKHEDIKNSNDKSCVLKIAYKHHDLLIIPGDISRKEELKIIKQHPSLKAKVLIASHHGSSGSNSKEFLATLQPDLLLYSAGYKNAYKFPNYKVVQRAKKLGIKELNTATSGAIEINFYLEETEIIYKIKQYRKIREKFYHHR